MAGNGLQGDGECLPCPPGFDVDNSSGWCASCTFNIINCSLCHFDGEGLSVCDQCIAGYGLLSNTNETAYPICADCTNNDTNCYICSFNSMGDGECNFCVNGTGLQ
jgi:hypothetical protein